ncbi:MAG TPA: hypothetical protein VMB21_03030 [Candidatus Limnocylindria bacterium]|nr:hypothetical protein [Candidatus Limnocylindria bacterium]
MFHFFTKKVLTKLFLIFWFGVFCPPLLLANWLIEHEPKLRLVAMWMGGFYGLACFLICFFLATSTADYMVTEHELLLTALRFALRDLRYAMTQLPVIGPWFVFKKDRPNRDED